MASSISRNRPESARRAMEKDPLRRNDSPATGLTEADVNSVIDAIASLQTVDLKGLRRRLNSTVPHDLKNGEDGHDANIRWAENVDWKKKYTDLEEKYDTLTAELKTTEQTSSEQKKELVVLQQRVESDDKSLKSLNQKLKEYMDDLESEEKRLQTQQKAMEEVKKAKDDALTRLSRQMGQQMSEGNPNITDLSDQNRPSKLGEIYSELYDNEWTNAFEVLTETFYLDDKSAIELLLKILWESSKHASVVSQSTMKTIEKLLSGSSEGPTPDCKRLLREARKYVDIKKADDLFQNDGQYYCWTVTYVENAFGSLTAPKDFLRELTRLLGRTHLAEKKVQIYSEKCFQLCWLMSIQDPPVVLSKDPERGAQFDTDLYKHYTNSGDNVDYVVWPALLLHKDGPLLAKGVAQPSPRQRAKSAPAVGRPTTRDDKSFDRRSQIQYDTKVREPASGSPRMDKTHNGHQDRNDEKVRESTSGFDRIDKTQYGYQSRNDEKVRESTSDFNRMDTTRYGYQARNDAAFLLKSDQSPMVTKTYSADGDKYRVHLPTPTARAQGQISGRTQLYQHDVFRSNFDSESFQRFCHCALQFDQRQLRRMYGTDYDRYYTLYNNLKYGNYKFV